MNYKDTLIDFSKVEWKPPTMELVDDGKIDLTIKVPVTDLVNSQAKRTWVLALKEYERFIKTLVDKPDEANAQIEKQYKEWGLLE